jgi:hypothetical protein
VRAARCAAPAASAALFTAALFAAFGHRGRLAGAMAGTRAGERTMLISRSSLKKGSSLLKRRALPLTSIFLEVFPDIRSASRFSKLLPRGGRLSYCALA